MSKHVSNDAEPGTGTQVVTVASPPCGCQMELTREDCGNINHEHPNSYRTNGVTWKVGMDYLDTEIGDVVELTGIVRRSSWCNTADAEDGELILEFEGERYGSYHVKVFVDPRNDRVPLHERFIERYTKPIPRGVEVPY